MNLRKNHKKMIEKKSRQQLIRTGAVLASLSILTLASATPVLASTWKANTPESIQIKEGQTSYTMVAGDTLWAISMKINVNVQTLSSINNIDLSSGEEYRIAIGTVIKWDKHGNLVAETPDGKQVNDGVKVNNSNKIIPDKPIGTDVTDNIKNNNISDNQIDGNPNNTGNNNSNESETPEGETSKPEDKWKDLTFEEREGGTILRIGPFNSREDANEYFAYRGFKAGYAFENELDGGKWYLDVTVKDNKPVDPTEPETNVGTVTIRYVNQDGVEIKDATIMTGTIGEMFNAIADKAISNYLLLFTDLPEGAVLLDDGNAVFRNSYTQKPQTVTFIYYMNSNN